ncbi:helix-turn-helix domain-containing protein [Enterococcus gilvus]|uniref:helix-turn-helix domain-containing protein n=1 Tax=Enterococcus gilvus TaxID=160453 RepID=UPI003EDA4E7B
MGLYEKIKQLADGQKISIRRLEELLGYGNGTIRRWEKQTPGVDKIQKVADFFDVSTDYLLGRSNVPSKNDEKLSEQEQQLLMRFRRGSKNVPEEKRELYNRQAMDVFDYISKTMRDLDEKNKPK